jgi:hypothetical protein
MNEVAPVLSKRNNLSESIRSGAWDTIFVVREVYEPGVVPEVAARAVRKIDRTLPIDIGGEIIANDEEISGVIDSASFADTGMGASRGAVINDAGLWWPPCEKGAGSVFAGLSAIHSRLRLREDGSPGLKIFRGCAPNLVRELTGLVYDSRNVEAYDPNCADHAISALRYGLLYKAVVPQGTGEAGPINMRTN